MAIATRPFIVGRKVGLNPRQPYYNSTDIPTLPQSGPADAPWRGRCTVVLQSATGTSLDSNTGLIYGKLVRIAASTSVIQYVGSGGVIHGTATITWNTVATAFLLLDNITDGIPTGTTYTGTTTQPTSYITVPPGLTPGTASI